MFKLLGKILVIAICFFILIVALPTSAIDGIKTVGNNAWQNVSGLFQSQQQVVQENNNEEENING